MMREMDLVGRSSLSAAFPTTGILHVQDRVSAHRCFWNGEGPSLLLIPASVQPLYDTSEYKRRFGDPELMWQAEMSRAREVIDWPTDGLPTVRPNLGVVFIPAMAGLDYEIREDQMPWPGHPLSREAIRRIPTIDITTAETIKLALRFYEIHRRWGGTDVFAYSPDTQGVFDIAHLLYREPILYELVEDPGWIRELMSTSLDLYLRASILIKSAIGENAREMVHGHGTPQGVFFTTAGVRISEDTPTLLSPRAIETWVLPYIEKAAAPFGGAFIHYCGRHKFFFEALCRMESVRAIDLGNSESYDPSWLLKHCADSGTVLYSRLPAHTGETWKAYTIRLGNLVADTGARVILRPTTWPDDRRSCEEMLALWHNLTR